MSFENNPADDRYQLDQCIDEIKSLQSQILTLTAELSALKAAPGMAEVDALRLEVFEWLRVIQRNASPNSASDCRDLQNAIGKFDAMLRRSIAAREKLVEGLLAVESLILESKGVAGLHLNGDLAEWDELRSGGRFGDWLYKFDDALEIARSDHA